MLLSGNISYTTDINHAKQMSFTHKVVIIGEVPEDVKQSVSGTIASILLPPYNSLEAIINGDNNTATVLYCNWLQMYEPTAYIASIIKALLMGINICLYIPKDQFELGFRTVLFSYIQMNYGISIGDNINVASMYDPLFDSNICTLLYLNNLLTSEEYLTYYPNELPLNIDCVVKLTNECNPFMEEHPLEDYDKYWYEYKERIKNAGHFLKKGIIIRK